MFTFDPSDHIVNTLPKGMVFFYCGPNNPHGLHTLNTLVLNDYMYLSTSELKKYFDEKEVFLLFLRYGIT